MMSSIFVDISQRVHTRACVRPNRTAKVQVTSLGLWVIS
jgi:hypothetical protein